MTISWSTTLNTTKLKVTFNASTLMKDIKMRTEGFVIVIEVNECCYKLHITQFRF